MLKATEAMASVDTEQWPRAKLEPSALSSFLMVVT